MNFESEAPTKNLRQQKVVSYFCNLESISICSDKIESGLGLLHLSLERTNSTEVIQLDNSYRGDVFTLAALIMDSSVSIAHSSLDDTACIDIDKFETSKVQCYVSLPV